MKSKKILSIGILFCLVFICGCAGSIAIKRSQYHKLFPKAQQEYNNMDKEIALKTFQEVIDSSFPDTRYPTNMIRPPSVNDEGISISIATYKTHEKIEKITTSINGSNYIEYSHHQEKLSDEHNTMKWIKVSKIKVTPMYNITFGKWEISVVGKWEEKSKFCYDFSFRVRTDEERDKAISSLLMLCPKIK